MNEHDNLTLSTQINWDAHSNLPLEVGRHIDDLIMHKNAGFDFVSINMGYDPAPLDQILSSLAWYRSIFAKSNKFVLINNVDELLQAKSENKLAVAFDLEGALVLLETPAMAGLLSDLGVRQMHLAYNRNNNVASGCYDPDVPLTALGKRMVSALNDAGIIIDRSHGGYRCSMDIMAHSDKPVVFSHSCAAAIHKHPRNITDEQIKACAASNGVVGVVGYSRFLGRTPSTALDMVRHIAYIANLVGPEHVGIGWDYGYKALNNDPMSRVDNFDWWFPDASKNKAEGLSPDEIFTPISAFSELDFELSNIGFTKDEIALVKGGNFFRVAASTWPKSGQ